MPSQFVMLTLTTQEPKTDEQMNRARERFLAWARKYLGETFEFYVWVSELQARGVLHFHVVVANRIPKPMFLRLRQLWTQTYGMGEGSVHIRPMRSAKGAAKYLAKYVTKAPSSSKLHLDAEGMITHEPWSVSKRTGEPYVRMRFRGNAYGMSKAARWLTVPVLEFAALEGAFPELEAWHATIAFYESKDEALAAIGVQVNARTLAS